MSIASEMLTASFRQQMDISGSDLKLPSGTIKCIAADDNEVSADDLAGDTRDKLRIQILRPLPPELVRGRPASVRAELNGQRISITGKMDNPALHCVELKAVVL